MDLKIKSIKTDDEKRIVHVEVEDVDLNRTETVNIESCVESYLQTGAERPFLWKTLPIAETFNEWMHGGEKPSQAVIKNLILDRTMSSKKFDDEMRSNIYESPDEEKGILYLAFDDEKYAIVAGTATNAGLIPHYEHEYDDDFSLDMNLQAFIEEIENN